MRVEGLLPVEWSQQKRNPRITTMTTTKFLTGLLIGTLLSTGALADNRIEMLMVQGAPQAKFSLGDSRCVLVGDVIKCMPSITASN
jgi:hypothetical protein